MPDETEARPVGPSTATNVPAGETVVDDPYGHIGDYDTVYMSHPDTSGVGSALGHAFKTYWAPVKGWYQVTQEEHQEYADGLAEQANAFTAAGVASPPIDTRPAGEGDAQDTINADTARRGRHV